VLVSLLDEVAMYGIRREREGGRERKKGAVSVPTKGFVPFSCQDFPTSP